MDFQFAARANFAGDEVADPFSRPGGLCVDDVAWLIGPRVRDGICAETLEKTIRERITNARRLNKMEQIDAARRMGYANSSALSKIESGFARIPKDFVLRAALAYGVSCDYLLGLSNEPERDPVTAEHMAIMRAIDATIQQQNHDLAKVLLRNVSEPHHFPTPTRARYLTKPNMK